jgi:hypothetical protein
MLLSYISHLNPRSPSDVRQLFAISRNRGPHLVKFGVPHPAGVGPLSHGAQRTFSKLDEYPGKTIFMVVELEGPQYILIP